ncbi:sugar phosphate nucleotidyltransferase [Nanoarchaeota archaeon]
MKAVILAAGKSTRTYPLTVNIPKPMIRVDRTTILEKNLNNLVGFVNEVIIVVGFRKVMIQKRIGTKYKGLKIRYVNQKVPKGTGHALSLARKFLSGSFILLMGDDLYSKKDIHKCLQHKYSVLAKRVKDPSSFGVYVLDKGFVKDIIEKPKKYISNLANCALYVLDISFLSELDSIKRSGRGEIEIVDAIKTFSRKNKVKCVIGKDWIPFVYPWDLYKITKKKIGRNCSIQGKVVNSIIMDNTIIEKGSVVRDSIIGENVRFSGTIKSGNVVVKVKNKKIKVKIGAIIGDNVYADKVKISPGVRIWPGNQVRGVIKKDVV